MNRTRALLAAALILSGTGLVAARLLDDDPAAGQAAVERSRVRSWARSDGGAGPSVLPKRVPAADAGELRRLDGLPGFHEYATRCASCHRLPDPGAYPAKRWIGKVDEMREHIRRAGVMPPAESEMQAATRFLGMAADSLRTP